jgi:tRNA1Val (adenine37-N6)-methyltransferase
MKNSYFRFKEFLVNQEKAAMKVTTDGCLFGAWIAHEVQGLPINNVLDIGTGTGLLSLMFAQKNAGMIEAIEIDQGAAMQAKENFLNSPWAERINVSHAPIQEIKFSCKYDIVLSNPPFYEKEIISSVQEKNIAHHSEGLLLKELLAIIKEALSPQGQFFLMLPYKRLKETEILFSKTNLGIEKRILIKQSQSHEYFRFFIKGRLNARDVYEQSELSIRDKDNKEYTEEFRFLLKDYYLNLV